MPLVAKDLLGLPATCLPRGPKGYGINDFSVKDTGVLMAATAAKTWNLLGKANDQTALQVAGAKTLARYGFCTQTPSATVRRILWGLRCAIAPP